MFNAKKEDLDFLLYQIAVDFEWSQTPQGYDYWEAVYKNLKKMSEALDENKELSA